MPPMVLLCSLFDFWISFETATVTVGCLRIRPRDALVVGKIRPIILTLASGDHSRDHGRRLCGTCVGTLEEGRLLQCSRIYSHAAEGSRRCLHRMLERIVSCELGSHHQKRSDSDPRKDVIPRDGGGERVDRKGVPHCSTPLLNERWTHESRHMGQVFLISSLP